MAPILSLSIRLYDLLDVLYFKLCVEGRLSVDMEILDIIHGTLWPGDVHSIRFIWCWLSKIWEHLKLIKYTHFLLAREIFGQSLYVLDKYA